MNYPSKTLLLNYNYYEKQPEMATFKNIPPRILHLHQNAY